MALTKSRYLRNFRAFFLKGTLVVSAVLVLTLVLIYLTAGGIYDYQDTSTLDQLPQVDAIVCLAGGRGRIALAGDIWFQYQQLSGKGEPKTPTLYIAGMGPQSSWMQLVKQFKPNVAQVIRPQDALIEKESSNTVANAQWLAFYAKERNWKKVLLVTSTYHMKRALLIFNRVLNPGGNVIKIETYSLVQDPFSSSSWKKETVGIRVTLIEKIKWFYYRFFWSP